MFTRSVIRRGVSPYSIFLMRYKNHPTLKAAKSIADRGRRSARLYDSLPKVERSVLNAIAAKSARFPKHPKGKRGPRKQTAFTKFVAKNFAKIEGPSRNRLAVIAKMWKKAKKDKKNKK